MQPFEWAQADFGNRPTVSRFEERENSQDAAIRRAQANFWSQPTISRFQEAAVIIEDTGCGLSKGSRQISEIDQPFPAFKRSWASLMVATSGEVWALRQCR
ncbi:hypothetical protein VE01_09434 [Pseudogymnoascus verrucosus]|uniref:Uncharacterized protein n=1 Tax=Pseudogymnoascus verrucosus TaxID=342668 RepID=A0A1B8G9J4_9PEZI|nr:uncharacterized protein VE01_09434 [Pseudogymnoascus verrucosus]OBT92504.1 hypothetical protein VE01_09434 [Pseudogymnoascus verrucosus]